MKVEGNGCALCALVMPLLHFVRKASSSAAPRSPAQSIADREGEVCRSRVIANSAEDHGNRTWHGFLIT